MNIQYPQSQLTLRQTLTTWLVDQTPSRPSSQPQHLRFYKTHTELNVLQNMLHSKSNTFNYHSSCAIRITSSICHIHIANYFHHSKIRTKKSNESIHFRPFHPGPTGAAGPSMAWQPCPARKTVLQLLTVSPQWGYGSRHPWSLAWKIPMQLQGLGFLPA